MQINSVSNSKIKNYSNAVTAKELSEAKDKKNIPNENKSKSILNLEKALEASRICLKYGSVKDMSPREISDMCKELLDKGIITQQDYRVLSYQPELNPNYNEIIGKQNNSKAKPDAKRDFIASWKDNLKTHVTNRNNKGVEIAKNAINILENLESLGKKYGKKLEQDNQLENKRSNKILRRI